MAKQKKYYYLFGELVCNKYHNEDFEEVIKHIQNGGDNAIYIYEEGFNHPSDLLCEADGWMGFAEITKEEYKVLEKIKSQQK